MRSTGQIRSQSVTQKDIKTTFKIKLEKRSSSKTKGFSKDKLASAEPALSNIGKVIKAELEM